MIISQTVSLFTSAKVLLPASVKRRWPYFVQSFYQEAVRPVAGRLCLIVYRS